MSETLWWQGAIIYQIYPRSFADSNGDGIGDLHGITTHLDYVASLGVDAIWLSPFFTSPMKDFGYDVADFRNVDPIFGTLSDFDELLARAHNLGLKVIIDQVYSHTSDQHPWFTASSADRSNPKSDWYVWADAKPDGTPPSNWQSVFGSSAWTWHGRRGQYYLHNFLVEQPDLNVHNAHVQEALLGCARFWFDRGVDGFRLDAINYALHDPQLRDNPPAPAADWPRTRPVDFQHSRYNKSHADLPHFVGRIRALAEEYGGRFLVAEIGGRGTEEEMQLLTAGEACFHTAYGFNFLHADKLTSQLVRKTLEAWPHDAGTGWPSWAFSNHDAPRVVSRWSDPGHHDAVAQLAMLLLMSLRGSLFLYQGEELGLPQAAISFGELRDPEAIANWPHTLGRDGARTPMPWRHDAPHRGFSTATPWLPVSPEHGPLAVDRQLHDPYSMLALTRRLIALRKHSRALRGGAQRFIDAPEDLLVFERNAGDETLLCVFNLSSVGREWRPSGEAAWQMLADVGEARAWRFPGFSGLIARRTK